jgi:hypothetical protein
VKRDRPHALIFLGPFVDLNNKDIAEGEIIFENPNTNKHDFIDYDELFTNLMIIIDKELDGLNTQVLIAPSIKDMHHVFPMPQAPYKMDLVNGHGLKMKPHMLSNP